jgi:hypothetical protein
MRLSRCKLFVTAQVAARGGRLPESIWGPAACGAQGEDQEVLTVGTKGLPRKTHCRASKALMPFLRAVDT